MTLLKGAEIAGRRVAVIHRAPDLRDCARSRPRHARGPRRIAKISWWSGLAEEDFYFFVALQRHGLELPGRGGQGHPDDLGALQRDHDAAVAVVHRVDRVQAEPRRQHPVECSRRPAPLHVPEDGLARLVSGALMNLPLEHLPDATEP